jgi:hypothetical protein
MLRAALILLLLANAGVWSWGQGWWPGAVPPDRAGREPQRLALQVRPETLQVQARRPAAQGAGSPFDAWACLEAGPLRAEAAAAVEATLVALGLSPGDWARVPAASPGGEPGVILRVSDADAPLEARLRTLADVPPGIGFSDCDTRQR